MRDVLDVLRARLSSEAILGAEDLRDALTASSLNDYDYVKKAQSLFKDAIEVLPSDLRKAARLMTGQEAATSGSFIQRADIVLAMGKAIPRRGRETDPAFGPEPLERRAVYYIEERMIAPKVKANLFEATPVEEKPAYRDVVIDVSVRQGTRINVLDIQVDMSLTFDGTSWLIAVTPDAVIADYLCKRHTMVNEVLCPSAGNDLPKLSLATRALISSPPPPQQRLFDRINAEDIDDLAAYLSEPSYGDVAWFRADWSDDPGTFESTRLTFSSTQSVNVGARHIYWCAPRSLHLTSLTFDWSSFPKLADYEFMVEPFFACLLDCFLDQTMRRCRIEVDGLVSAGSGAVLIWEDVDS